MSVRTGTLANGLRVVSESIEHLRTTSVGVWVDAGARHETPEQNGVAHLLEHMAFKGTERRSAQAIAEEIEAVGGHLNAYTGREQTAYFARVLANDVPLAVDLLGDILLNSTFEAGELEREREVVIQEIAQTHDTPDDLVFDRLQEVAYPEQAIGRSILGTAERVAGHGRARLKGYMDLHYRSPRMVLAAAGAVDHDELVGLAEVAFDGLAGAAEVDAESAAWQGGDWRENRDLEQAHLALGFDAVSYHDDDFFPLQMLSTILGGGMSSRLFQEVREKRGLAYSVFSFSSAYVDGGLFGVYAGTSPESLTELVPVICEEIGKLTARIGEEEIGRARAQLKAGLLMSLESSAARIEQIGRQILIFGRPLSSDEVIAKFDAVDAAALARAAARLARVDRPAVAAIGPIDRLESYADIAARFG